MLLVSLLPGITPTCPQRKLTFSYDDYGKKGSMTTLISRRATGEQDEKGGMVVRRQPDEFVKYL